MIKLPKDVTKIIEIFYLNNFKAYAVGGCIRDMLMNVQPNDWDIATSALPQQIKAIFPHTIDTGLKHGTVTVLYNNCPYEITTFRTDGEYSDNRRPDKVFFTSSIIEDLSRRDFTINSIAYNPEEGLIDPFKGAEDIKQGIIKAVGNADLRFKEDALRMLRAVRFSAKLNFVIEDSVLLSMKANSHLILNISYERIRDELTKILLSDYPDRLKLLYQANILCKILPEFNACFSTEQNNPYHAYNVAEHSLIAVKNIDKLPALRWCMLLHDIGKPVVKFTDANGIDHFYGHPAVSATLAEAIMKRLKFDNNTIEKVYKLIQHHDLVVTLNQKSVRKAVNKVGEELFIDWLKVRKADILSQNPIYFSNHLKALEQISAAYQEILLNNQCVSVDKLAVNGYDLIEAGFKQGREIGQMLNHLLELVIETPEINNKTALLEYAQKQLNN